MAATARARRQDRRQARSTPVAPDAPQLTLADESAAPAASPARALQTFLESSIGERPADAWRPRTTLLFIVGVCGGFWLGLAWLLHLALR